MSDLLVPGDVVVLKADAQLSSPNKMTVEAVVDSYMDNSLAPPALKKYDSVSQYQVNVAYFIECDFYKQTIMHNALEKVG
jgi:hypothetical protein